MRKNKAKEIIKNGNAVINGWLQIPSTVSAETMAQQGWDSLTIDMQHGLVDYTNAMPMMQVISATEVVPLASCLLYTSPSPRDQRGSRMPSSA